MRRYFIEVAYLGTHYAGFQIQDNAPTIQGEIEKAMLLITKTAYSLTGSSRTDAGVHAMQNYFHFDDESRFTSEKWIRATYNLNAVLPQDIVIKSIKEVPADLHARFSAVQRDYCYTVITSRDPFLKDQAYVFPYKVDKGRLNQAADLFLHNTNFINFSKKHSDVLNYNCRIQNAYWSFEGNKMEFYVGANRFLRGMVKALTGTSLKFARGKLTEQELKQMLSGQHGIIADFTPPSKGLCLKSVKYS